MRNRLSKKIILATVCIISSIGLTGCGETIQQYATTHLPEAIQSRAARNIEIATEFYEIGALSTAQYEKCVKEIQKQADKYTNDSDSKKMLESLAKSVTQMHTAGYSDGRLFPQFLSYIEEGETSPTVLMANEDNGRWEFWDSEAGKFVNSPCVENNNASGKPHNSKRYTVMSNYLATEVLGGKLSEGLNNTNSQNITINGTISPIVFIDDSIMDSLNNMVKMEVYVLKPEITTNSGINDLDGIMKLVQQVADQDSNGLIGTKKDQDIWNAKVSYLNNYFTPALDSNGDPITLIDKSDTEFNLVKVSEPNGTGVYKLGLDMWVAQDDINDCLRVRFQEFNEDAVSKLKEYIGDHKFYIVPDAEGSWKAYLMEYPIDVIDSMKLCNRSDDWAKDAGGFEKVEVKLKKSGLGINLMTGQFVKYKHKGGVVFDWTDAETIDIGTEDYYLTTSGSQNNDSSGLSSLVVKGISDVEIKNSKDKTIKLNCGRIILRDYLEATYAPNYTYNSGEKNMVVFGRKIRFNMSNSNFFKDTTDVRKIASKELEQDILVYERGQTVANFVDLHGEEVPGSPTLEITDFCTFSELQKIGANNCTVLRLPYKNEGEVINTRDVNADTPDITDLSVRNDMAAITPVSWFPSPDIGVTDYNADTKQKQRFYCIATTKGMFGSALFSSWVESTVPEANLDWWNEYLDSNGFSYRVEHVDVVQYLSDNFRYQLSQNGIVIIDLETVGKIQEMYDEEADQKRVGAIRTIFILLGWLLIVGSFLLMLLWVFDTNTDIGFGLLEKATFGNWVAVKYEEDIPAHNVNDQKYVCFRDICIRVMIMIAIGFVLIRIDIFYILSVLVEMFGNIASNIEKLIKGRIG